MKKLLILVFIFTLTLSFCGCSKTSVKKANNVTLSFVYNKDNIVVELEKEEAQKVISILDGNTYDSIFSGTPSCGFDKNISLKVGGKTFAVARDTCNYIQDLSNLGYFTIAKEDMDYIHSLFEKYGGHFPCI